MRAAFPLVSAVLLAGCAGSPHPSHDSDTVYLAAGDALLAPSPTPARVKARPAPTPKPTSKKDVATPSATPMPVPALSSHEPPSSAPFRPVVVDESLSARRERLLKRVEDLSGEEADSVCLTMQLVAREQIFDRSVKPKKILLRYTSQGSSSDLDFLERVLNDPRR